MPEPTVEALSFSPDNEAHQTFRANILKMLRDILQQEKKLLEHTQANLEEYSGQMAALALQYRYLGVVCHSFFEKNFTLSFEPPAHYSEAYRQKILQAETRKNIILVFTRWHGTKNHAAQALPLQKLQQLYCAFHAAHILLRTEADKLKHQHQQQQERQRQAAAQPINRARSMLTTTSSAFYKLLQGTPAFIGDKVVPTVRSACHQALVSVTPYLGQGVQGVRVAVQHVQQNATTPDWHQQLADDLSEHYKKWEYLPVGWQDNNAVCTCRVNALDGFSTRVRSTSLSRDIIFSRANSLKRVDAAAKEAFETIHREYQQQCARRPYVHKQQQLKMDALNEAVMTFYQALNNVELERIDDFASCLRHSLEALLQTAKTQHKKHGFLGGSFTKSTLVKLVQIQLDKLPAAPPSRQRARCSVN